MEKDIAIVGMALRCADAENISELMENIYNKEDAVRPLSEERIKDTTLDATRPLRNLGALKDVDKFDYKFFNISYAEAVNMDPNQRLLLEVVYEAIENSGYSADYFDGMNAAVFLSDVNPEYYKLSDSFDDTMIAGNSPAFAAARIARQFNLTGNALVVDTACSSSLVAVHLACNELIMGECDYAFVGGSNLNFMPYADKEMEYSIWSSDGKSRAFSEQADGMSCGEMVCCIILKPLGKALEDGDHISAVIKSTAVNNNANRSSSPSAPDSISQANVLKQAWEKANIDPINMGYIEAHGSGTKLGDSLEVEGLTAAFREYTEKKGFCSLSTVKSNIGHGYGVAGLAGLVKAALSLRHKYLYPTIHVDELNSMIDFPNSAVYVETEGRPWQVSSSQPRIAGVTSLGASGTNCHVVLEEAPELPFIESIDLEQSHIITISSATPSGLENTLNKYLKFLDTADDKQLGHIAFTQNTGRMHYQYRVAFIISSLEEFRNSLTERLEGSFSPSDLNKNKRKLIYIFSDYAFTESQVMAACKQSYTFRTYVEACTEAVDELTGYGWCFAFEYAMYHLLQEHGVQPDQFLCEGIGKIVAQVLQQKISLREGLLLSQQYKKEAFANIESRVSQLLNRFSPEEYAFISMSYPEEISETIAAHNGKGLTIIQLEHEDSRAFQHYLANIYLLFERFDWSACYKDKKYHRVELPGYSFEKNRLWIRETPWIEKSAKGTELTADDREFLNKLNVIEKKIVGIWEGIFERKIMSLEDDFFDIGGDSLKATQVISELQQFTDVDLDFEDIFDFPTILELSSYVTSQMSLERQIMLIFAEVLKSENIDVMDSFFDLGGHSLMANQLLVRMRTQFEIALNFEDVYNNPSAHELAGFIQAKKDSSAARTPWDVVPLQPVAPQDLYYASDAQKQMWIMSRVDKANTAYNSPFKLTLQGEVKHEILMKAIHALMERHESLRTVFMQREGELYQIIQDTSQLSVPIQQYQGVSADDAESIMAQDINTPFDLEKGPLFRVIVFYNGEQTLLYFNIHHIIHDGWSSKVFLNDFITIYNAFYHNKENPLAPLGIQYKDYAEWQRKILADSSISAVEEYWKRQLLPESIPLDLTIAMPRNGARKFSGERISIIYSPEQMQKIESFCQEKKITMYMFYLTALNILLYKYSGATDLCVGSPVAGRNLELLEDQIGYYANTVVLRTKNLHKMTIHECIQNVTDTTLGAFSNQMYPFDKLIQLLNIARSVDRNPLFDVMLVLQNTSMISNHELHLSGAKLCGIDDLGVTSLFDLHFEIADAENGTRFSITYNIELFEQQDIRGMMKDFQCVMELIRDNQSVPIHDIQLQHADQHLSGMTKWEMDDFLNQLENHEGNS